VGSRDLLRINLQLFAEEEKTEDATPHKKREVRKEGQVARSSDLNAVANLLAIFLLVFFMHRYFIWELYRFTSLALTEGMLRTLTDSELLYVFVESSVFMFKFLAPIFVIGLVAGLAANLGQVGFLFAPKVIQPKLSNINPVQGFKRLFSKRSLVDLLKAIFKVVIVSWVTFVLVKNNFKELLFIIDMSVGQILQVVMKVIFRVAAGAIGVFFAIAVLDYIFQRYEFRQRIKMTRKELKDEFKQTEGDPFIKSKLKERQRQLAQLRMMQSIPEATVVITNPTHLAVALKYETGEQEAPEVVAKGAGYVAEKIVQLAKEHSVPVVENEPVAQFIYKNVEIGEEIPPELYKAVAEILAMIYRLRNKK